MDCNPQGSSILGTSQARILEWVAISCSRGSSWPRNQTDVSCFSCIGKQILYHCPTWKTLYINIQMYVYIHAHRHMHIQANISLFLKKSVHLPLHILSSIALPSSLTSQKLCERITYANSLYFLTFYSLLPTPDWYVSVYWNNSG